jgi:hypothetical protein
MIFIGYKQGSKAYCFYYPTHQQIFVSSTVTFDEGNFLCCSKKVTPIDKLSSIPHTSSNIEEEALTPGNKNSGTRYPDQIISFPQAPQPASIHIFPFPQQPLPNQSVDHLRHSSPHSSKSYPRDY